MGRTVGVGGSTIQEALGRLSDMTKGVTPPQQAEYEGRIAKAASIMQAEGLDAVYLNAGTNLYYFTGTRWYASERMVGALLTKDGELLYIAPAFEISTLNEFMVIKSHVAGWEEHECPYALVASLLKGRGLSAGKIGLDESTAFFISDGLKLASPDTAFVSAKNVTAGCRMEKSDSEIALIQRAMDMTIEVHKATASILKEGITTTEVTNFINEAHKRVGADGSSFCIVLFGEATAYPHGVKDPQTLKEGDMVLVDTGCRLFGYNSDITRSYVYGEPDERQRTVWNHEKVAQAKAFDAAKPSVPTGEVDVAARSYLETVGYGPDYAVPGLPHRTGHGLGLDIHEWPYLVRSDRTPLTAGMVFSNEPMICIYGEFGVRLEDHFYITDTGAKWFTTPSHSIDDPFGLKA